MHGARDEGMIVIISLNERTEETVKTSQSRLE